MIRAKFYCCSCHKPIVQYKVAQNQQILFRDSTDFIHQQDKRLPPVTCPTCAEKASTSIAGDTDARTRLLPDIPDLCRLLNEPLETISECAKKEQDEEATLSKKHQELKTDIISQQKEILRLQSLSSGINPEEGHSQPLVAKLLEPSSLFGMFIISPDELRVNEFILDPDNIPSFNNGLSCLALLLDTLILLFEPSLKVSFHHSMGQSLMTVDSTTYELYRQQPTPLPIDRALAAFIHEWERVPIQPPSSRWPPPDTASKGKGWWKQLLEAINSLLCSISEDQLLKACQAQSS